MSKSVQSDFSSAGDSKCSESTLCSIHCNSSLQTNNNNVQDPPYVQYTVVVHFKQTRTMFRIHPIFNLITLKKVLSSPYLPYILQQGILITLNKLKCQNLFNPTFLQQGIPITLKMKQTIG
uniref:Uncharacterized protein n=1 Tax=Cacopsylla melanoneura TaxID=428564 RepID=A0A8D8Q0T6_9HEMI